MPYNLLCIVLGCSMPKRFLRIASAAMSPFNKETVQGPRKTHRGIGGDNFLAHNARNVLHPDCPFSNLRQHPAALPCLATHNAPSHTIPRPVTHTGPSPAAPPCGGGVA